MRLCRILVSTLALCALPAGPFAAGYYVRLGEYKQLLQNLKSPNIQVSHRAAKTLSNPGDPSSDVGQGLTDALKKAIANRDLRFVQAIVGGLSVHGPIPASALPLLLQCIEKSRSQSDEDLLRSCLFAIAALDISNPNLIPTLEKFLKDSDPRVASNAADAIAGKSEFFPALGPTLVQALKSPSNGLVESAEYALSKSDYWEEGEVSLLITNMRGTGRWALSSAADTLAKLGPKAVSATPALTELLTSPDPDKASIAARVLGEIGPSANSSVPALAEVLQHAPNNNPEARRAASIALAKIGDKAALFALQSALNGSNEDLCLAAEDALAIMGAPAAVALPDLSKLLSNDSSDVRFHSATAIETITKALDENRPKSQQQMSEAIQNLRVAQKALNSILEKRSLKTTASRSTSQEVDSTLASLLKDQQTRKTQRTIWTVILTSTLAVVFFLQYRRLAKRPVAI